MKRAAALVLCALILAFVHRTRADGEAGLLFYLSGDRGLTADRAAGGHPEPNFASDVRLVADGAKGGAIECGDTQLLSYRAPGNIYAQRGTLSFFWRAREPVGKTAFPIFRVGYADHSSWDMAWLRLDYNGGPGFDAFVTDASLARTRVSVPMAAFPSPKQWTHLALVWDETRGIRFYVNGRLAARQDGTATFDAALDQFGPHSRTISPMQVQSAYNFVRGGDIDELRIYDRMLEDDHVASLARGDAPAIAVGSARTLDRVESRDEWWYRYGWNRPGDAPPPLDAPTVAIRKLGILDVYDVKRWWWKATDGIRETTWPGVYNRSRLPGRSDYFLLPDWDAYSTSGKSVTFTMPDEPWNQVEIAGAAWGAMTAGGRPLFERPKGQERTFHRLPQPLRGGTMTFTNVEQETPIGELSAYNVSAGTEPQGIVRLTYRLTAAAEPIYPDVKPLVEFVNGRHAADERTLMLALPSGAPRVARAVPRATLPIVHVLVPSDFRDVNIDARRTDFSYTWANMPGGLDGIAIDLPALDAKPTHGDLIPMNVQVKDPLWPLRDMLDVSFSIRPRERHTIWLDLRDRLLPNGRPLYLTLASASPDFGAASLEGAELRLVFKAWSDAVAEHIADRFAQVRDNYANIIEERPNTRRLSLYARFEADLTDLLRVAPDHELARQYWYDANREQPRPRRALTTPPPGVPLWAARQVELLRSVKRFVLWYIDRRQIENGEFGGGLSDDGDLTNDWPGTAFMGVAPQKIRESLLREMEAYYAQGMFTNGLSTIQADELHSYEEGIQVLGQSLLLDYGGPTHLERAMETTAAIARLTGINGAGHRHIRSSYFSGTTISEEGVWGWSKPSSYLILHPALALVDFNGSPNVRKWLLELADGVLAHRKPDANGAPALRATVEFATDKDLAAPATERVWPLLWAAFRWTGDRRYLQPMLDAGPRSLAGIASNALDIMNVRAEWGAALVRSPGPDAGLHFAWQVSGDTRQLVRLYEDQIGASDAREYINTEGSLWIDRVTVPGAELQRARLGGVALVRNAIVPGHVVSWSFDAPGEEDQVAILIPEATPQKVRIIAHNLRATPVKARMTGWDIAPGAWTIVQDGRTREIELDRSSDTEVTFAPGPTTIEMEHVKGGVPYWSRPDLGISASDVRIAGRDVTITIHSLGAVEAPSSRLVLRSRDERVIARANVPALPAPVDLRPRTAVVHVRLPNGADLAGGTVTVESAGSREITSRNNQVQLRTEASSRH